jgi:hypothetical protein
MKMTATAVLALTLYSTATSGQTNGPPPSAVASRTIKIWTGVGLIAAGMVVMPVTGVGHTNGRYEVPLVSIGLVTGGGTLVWWGMRARQRPRSPNTTGRSACLSALSCATALSMPTDAERSAGPMPAMLVHVGEQCDETRAAHESEQ